MKMTLKTKPASGPAVEKHANPTAMKTLTNKHPPYKLYLLLGLALAGIVATFLVPPIPQDPTYHHFADNRTIFFIPNFWDVVSNLPFLLVGLAGMASVAGEKPAGLFPQLIAAYVIFFLGIFLTGIGSGYYHLRPNNATLLWDRLPMTIAFMAFFAITIGEFISQKAARNLLLPLLLIGVSSVIYWHFTEQAGRGDLRFYLLVQFLPILLIPLILLLFSSGTTTNRYTWLVVLAYVVAKAFETFDEQLLEVTGFLSGHTLKHLAAAGAPLIFLVGLYKRRLKTASAP